MYLKIVLKDLKCNLALIPLSGFRKGMKRGILKISYEKPINAKDQLHRSIKTSNNWVKQELTFYLERGWIFNSKGSTLQMSSLYREHSQTRSHARLLDRQWKLWISLGILNTWEGEERIRVLGKLWGRLEYSKTSEWIHIYSQSWNQTDIANFS